MICRVSGRPGHGIEEGWELATYSHTPKALGHAISLCQLANCGHASTLICY